MKHQCPYLNSKNECSNKQMNLDRSKKLAVCPYNNPNKCRWYNQWLKERKLAQDGLKWLRQLNERDPHPLD